MASFFKKNINYYERKRQPLTGIVKAFQYGEVLKYKATSLYFFGKTYEKTFS